MSKLFYILCLFILVVESHSFAQNVAPKDYLGSAPSEVRSKINYRPLDTSGGIKLKTASIAGGTITLPWNWLPLPSYGMKPGNYEKRMGFKFGDENPCMYKKGIQYYSKQGVGVCASFYSPGGVGGGDKYQDLSYNQPTEDFLEIINDINFKNLLSIDAVAQTINSGDSCETIFDRFFVYRGGVDVDYKTELDACMYHCKNPDIIDDKYKAVCGVNDCNMKYANAASASSWCNYLAKQLNSSFGSSSPLYNIYQKTKNLNVGEFFGECVEKWVKGGSASDECCLQADLMVKYSIAEGAKFTDYCSHKKVQSICHQEYVSKNAVHPSCCALAKKYGGGKYMPDIGDDPRMQVFAASVDSYCSGFKKQNYSFFNNCISKYDAGKGRIVEDCCKAYALGILIPSRDGINYPALAKFCDIKN